MKSWTPSCQQCNSQATCSDFLSTPLAQIYSAQPVHTPTPITVLSTTCSHTHHGEVHPALAADVTYSETHGVSQIPCFACVVMLFTSSKGPCPAGWNLMPDPNRTAIVITICSMA